MEKRHGLCHGRKVQGDGQSQAGLTENTSAGLLRSFKPDLLSVLCCVFVEHI